jgi:uncharacterized membrane protein YqjE
LSGNPVSATPGGLVAAASRLGTTLLVNARTRLELIGNELEEEKQRLIRIALLGQALALCAGIAVVLGFAVLALAFWEQRLLVVGAGALSFLGAAGLFYAALQRALAPRQSMFASSLVELEEDVRQLKAALREAPPAK